MRELKHFRMRRDMAQGIVAMHQWMRMRSEPCAFLSRFSFFSLFFKIGSNNYNNYIETYTTKKAVN